MTARLEAWLDQEDARVTAMIRRYGWSVEYIYGDGCPGPDELEPTSTRRSRSRTPSASSASGTRSC